MNGPIRFASYELDPIAGELRKSGIRVPLSGQPLDVLALLLSRPGELISRDELKQALWPDDTFVDFDNGVNSAIRRIRRALDDSATEPRFIETLPKRGYRFIGTTEVLENGASVGPAVPLEATEAPRRRRAVVALGVAAVTVVLLWFATGRHAPEAQRAESVVPLTSLPGIEQHPTFSPDGSQVAFSWNGGGGGAFDIYLQTVAGGDARPVVADSDDEIVPVWSPDGQWIAFWRLGEGQGGIHLVRPVGGGEKRLLTLDVSQPIGAGILSSPYYLSWSADSKWIAFTDFRVKPWGISAISVDGARRQLTSPPEGALDFSPSYSPDGSRLAWKRWFGEFTEVIYTTSLADGRAVEVSGRLRDIGRFLTWSPDSNHIIFDGRRYAGLRMLRLSDGATEAIPNATPAVQPAVSSNRRRLAFARQVDNLDILRVDLVEGSLEPASARVLFSSTQSEFAPQISPDGLRILQGSFRAGPLQLWTASSDGLKAVPLAEGAGSGRWSPSGAQIAFDRAFPNADGYGVWVIDAEGGAPKSVTQPAVFASQPCWSEDGATIYFNRRVGGEIQIWATAASGPGEPRQITTSGQRCWESAGWVYFTREADVWRARPSGASAAEMVLEQRLFQGSAHWQVTGNYLYFIDFREGRRDGKWKLKRLNLSTREVLDIVNLPQEPSRVNGLTVAPYEAWFLYTVDNKNQQDLYAIEGFDWEARE